jgi:uncharacterized protein
MLWLLPSHPTKVRRTILNHDARIQCQPTAGPGVPDGLHSAATLARSPPHVPIHTMAPTNVLRDAPHKPKPAAKPSSRPRAARRDIIIRAGSAVIRARLLTTPTADRIWEQLPLYTTAETWGQSVHFETHAETGREADAVATVTPGQIAYWSEYDRILIGYGETPISGKGEIRLPSPCNVWAQALDDVTALAAVQPGERVAVLKADS